MEMGIEKKKICEKTANSITNISILIEFFQVMKDVSKSALKGLNFCNQLINGMLFLFDIKIIYNFITTD